jgi:prophage regulatory protein
MDRILRLPEVKTRTGLSRSSIYSFIKESKFPKSVNIGIRSVGWLESDINSWISSKIPSSHGGKNV